MTFDSAAAVTAPWWDQLPEDYYLEAVRTELDAIEPLKIMSTAALDCIQRSCLGRLLLMAMGPGLVKPGGLRRQLHQAEFYKPLAEAGNADAVLGRQPVALVPWKSLSASAPE